MVMFCSIFLKEHSCGSGMEDGLKGDQKSRVNVVAWKAGMFAHLFIQSVELSVTGHGH